MKYAKSLLKGAKTLGIVYALAGASAMLTADVTGHPSADFYLGKGELTRLEKAVYKPVFERFDVRTQVMQE